MALPKRKMSRSRTGHRRSQWKINLPTLVVCPNPACGKLIKPHSACGYCGHYDGVVVAKVKQKKE